MASATDYRLYAAECLRLAQQAPGEKEKTLLLEMAERWRVLAEIADRESKQD